MCGICGYITAKPTDLNIINKMNTAMSHRGPDDSGEHYILNANGNQIAMGQARLSIIDLSAGGHQPMLFKHLTIVFNGEIYNYKEIKAELTNLNHEFNSGSDTEVILHAFDQWGMDAVNKFIGMFAFAIYNAKTNKLYCCRDRAGAKPFYYYYKNGTFLFGSELKVFHAHPYFEKEINKKAVEVYFRYRYIPAPYTIFSNAHKLEAGNWLIYDLETNQIEIKNYWNIIDVYTKPKLKIDYQEAKSELKKILVSACNYRMVADVPVGIFLSGGFDSTLVASVVQNSSPIPLKSFTIGFEEGNNEAPYAKETAKYLGTDHTEYYCTQKESIEIINDLPFIFDEPFADSSAIPTILVSKLAVKEVKVALSADAGDEVFVGYNRYVTLLQNSNKVKQVPNYLRKLSSKFISTVENFVPDNKMFEKHKLKVFSNTISQNQMFDSLNLLDGAISTPPQILNKLILNNKSNYNLLVDKSSFGLIESSYDAALAYDYMLYLQNDILTKVDKAAMSVSLEGREPLLDHRIAEYAATLPLAFKYDGITTKKILKDIVYDYVPKEMMERPKAGFSIPINKWLKSSLSELIDREINYDEIRKQGILNADFIKQMITDFKNNKFFYETLIWEVLQFQMWYNRWMK